MRIHLTFGVKAWDQAEEIGEGTHQRFVIEEDRFLQRAASKGVQ